MQHMNRRKGGRKQEDGPVNCRLLTDEGNNQMKLGNEHKALLIYTKVINPQNPPFDLSRFHTHLIIFMAVLFT